jgi:hypothetical protein
VFNLHQSYACLKPFSTVVLEILFDGGNQRLQRKPEIPEKTTVIIAGHFS